MEDGPISFEALVNEIRRVDGLRTDIEDEEEDADDVNSVTAEPEGEVVLETPKIDARSIEWKMSGKERSISVEYDESDQRMASISPHGNDPRGFGISDDDSESEPSPKQQPRRSVLVREATQDFVTNLMDNAENEEGEQSAHLEEKPRRSVLVRETTKDFVSHLIGGRENEDGEGKDVVGPLGNAGKKGGTVFVKPPLVTMASISDSF